MTETLIIVGAGHAAGQAVISLRTGGFDGRIVLIGEEPYVPYERPPLSKQFLAGDMELERVYLRPADFYDEAKVELQLGRRVESLDRDARTVTLDDASRQSWDRLLLTTWTCPAPTSRVSSTCAASTTCEPSRRFSRPAGGSWWSVAAISASKWPPWHAGEGLR